MKIETKYSLGDTAWKINQNKPKVWIPCTFCGGSKHQLNEFVEKTEVTGLDGSKKRCPDCFGRGGNHDFLELEWRVERSLVIGQVRFEVSENKPEEESYMEDSRGVYVHYADTLYPTKNEAQAECDKRNKENDDD